MRSSKVILLVVGGFVFAGNATHAQFTQQGSKLVGTGAAGFSEQGASVSLSSDGNTAIIGGYADNDGAGAVWVFTRAGGVWSQQGSKLVGTDAVGIPYQGTSVSLSSDGNTAIVGGPGDNPTGAAWVFTRAGGVWSQQGNKLIGTGAEFASQGVSVSLSSDGNTAIVGGNSDNNWAGAAWVFTRAGGVWSQQGNKLAGTGAAGMAYQGTSVSLSSDGNTAIVGGSGDNGYVGAVWVFTRAAGVWSQQGTKLVGTGAVGTAYQGTSVSLSSDGNTAIVGGFGDNVWAGAVWVFTRVGGVWSQQGSKLLGTGSSGIQYQGCSVSLSSNGNTAIVGGSQDNVTTGAAWIFTRVGGMWSQLGSKLVGTGAVGHTYQGTSVFLSSGGNTAIVGGPKDNGDPENGVGAAWVYVLNESPSNLSVKDVPNDQGGRVKLRWQKSFYDDTVAARSPHVQYYSIWRAIPPGARPAGRLITMKEMCTDFAGKAYRSLSTSLGYDWEWLANQPSHNFSTYAYAASTSYDSMSTTNGMHYFLVSAQTNDPNVYWDSEPDSGWSVDNLSPSTPTSPHLEPLANGPMRVYWNQNRVDPDVSHYTVYRSTTDGFPIADSTRFRATADTTLTDSTTMIGGRYYYRITAVDIHGNESVPTAQLGDEALPIQLATFTATPVHQSQVRLDWTTLSEINNYGFEVQKSDTTEQHYQSIPNVFIPGHGTTNEPQHYSYIDSTVTAGAWYYRLKQIDLDGTISYSDGVRVNLLTDVQQNESPLAFSLLQNYPNPWNPSTTIRYGLPHSSFVTLTVYTTLGQQVAQLVNEQQQPGYHEAVFRGEGLASGVYFYRLAAGQFTSVKKLLLLK